MPPVVAAIAAVAAWTVTVAGVSIAAGSILIGVIVSTGLTLAAQAIIGRPKSLLDRGQTVSFRSPAAAAQIVYGETRVSGPIVFMATSGFGNATDNKFLWVSVALAGHEVESIGDVYLNDEVVQFDTEESGTISYADSAFTWPYLGGAQGRASTAPAGGLRDWAWVLKRLGTYDQPVQANVAMGKPSLALTAITPADTFKGIAYLAGTFCHKPDKFPSGPPNMSAIVKGRKVYDPRVGAHDIDDPTTWEWSDNPALCLADYLRGCPMLVAAGVVKRPYGIGASDNAIDWDSVIEAANICDESIPFSGGTQKRYTCNGTIDTDVSPKNAIPAIASSMAGSVAYSGGLWKIYAGAYRTPTVSLDENDQCGPAKTQARRARRDLFNGIKGKFRGPASFYQTTDFPNVSSAAFIEQDNGEEIWQEVELPFTDNAATCQRIAKIDLYRNRSQIITERTFKLSALGTQVGDVILLTDARKGWNEKPFEITRWSLRMDRDSSGAPAMVIDMTLAETSAAIYDWDASEEQLLREQPSTNLPRPWVVAVPGAPGIVESLYSTRDGSGVKTRVTLSWVDAGEGYFLDYIPEFKPTAETDWQPLPAVTGTSISIDDVAAGVYDFRVKTRNTLGVSSEYSTSLGLTVYGLGAAPSALAGLGIQPLGNQAVLAWDQALDLDVREGGKIEFRHSPALSGVTWANSTQIREAVSGQQSYANVPLKAGTYIVRPVDSSGIPGETTSVTTKQASINGFAALSGSPVTEETSFAGTHSGTVGSGSVLKLANSQLWDDIPDLDALGTNIDETGGISESGVYTFANAYDFGSVTRARLTSKIAASITSILSNIDDIEALIDDWDSFDGDQTGGQADAWVEYRQTDDDPSGSPTWTSWQRLDTAEVECRGVQFRAQLRSYDTAYNIEITTLQVAAESRS
jgi:hypothetical protein